MEFLLERFTTWFLQSFDLPQIFMFLLAGSGCLLFDREEMEAKGLAREGKWAKTLGLLYIIGGLVLLMVTVVITQLRYRWWLR